MYKVRFEWANKERESNPNEYLPPITELPFIPSVDMEIESGAFGTNWWVKRVVWIYNDRAEDCHLIVFVL